MPRDTEKKIKKYQDRIRAYTSKTVPPEEIEKFVKENEKILQDSKEKGERSTINIKDAVDKIYRDSLEFLPILAYAIACHKPISKHAKNKTGRKTIKISPAVMEVLNEYKQAVNAKSINDTIIILYKKFIKINDYIAHLDEDTARRRYGYIIRKCRDIALDDRYKSKVEKTIKVSEQAESWLFNIKEIICLKSKGQAIIYLAHFVKYSFSTDLPI